MATATPSKKPAASKAAPAKPKEAKPAQVKPSIMDRLMDWLTEAPADAASAEAKRKPKMGSAPPVEASPPAERWNVYQKIWGEGFSMPGGPDYALDLVKPFNLKPSMSVLDLSAGLGGGARAMVDAFDMWVTCMEPDAEVAAACKAISVQKGADNRAPMEPYLLDELKLPAAKFDCILLREALHLFLRKPETLQIIKQALKPNGQLIVTDFIARDRAQRSEEFQRWQALWPLKPDPWTKDECVDCLKNLEFSVHIIKEEPALYRGLVLSGWARFMANMNKAELTKEFLRLLVIEIERWYQLARALDTGELSYLRLHLSRKAMRLPSDP